MTGGTATITSTYVSRHEAGELGQHSHNLTHIERDPVTGRYFELLRCPKGCPGRKRRAVLAEQVEAWLNSGEIEPYQGR